MRQILRQYENRLRKLEKKKKDVNGNIVEIYLNWSRNPLEENLQLLAKVPEKFFK